MGKKTGCRAVGGGSIPADGKFRDNESANALLRILTFAPKFRLRGPTPKHLPRRPVPLRNVRNSLRNERGARLTGFRSGYAHRL